ncbi:roadblock/LC7 domain-containing protein [candidate division KSB1 bacterium]|nr:roadblock/LC7 domain-containing protein [candidate division KSB1 bacterium]
MNNNFVLNSELMSKINQIINEIKSAAEIDCVILTDQIGQLIACYKRNEAIPVENLAALMGGYVGAVEKIATGIQEKDGFEFNLHEGRNFAIIITPILNTFLLGISYHRSIATGKIRMLTLQVATDLEKLADAYNEQNPIEKSLNLNKNFSDKFTKQFDKMITKKKVEQYQIDLARPTPIKSA